MKSYFDIDFIYMGPRCDYHPEKKTTIIGRTWQELEAYRRENVRRNKLMGGEDPDVPKYAHKFLEGEDLEDIQRALTKQLIRRIKNKKYEANYLKLIASEFPVTDSSIKTDYFVQIPVLL